MEQYSPTRTPYISSASPHSVFVCSEPHAALVAIYVMLCRAGLLMTEKGNLDPTSG